MLAVIGICGPCAVATGLAGQLFVALHYLILGQYNL